MEPLIKCNELVKTFRGKDVLKRVSFEMPHGLTLILGKNGSGKTTLIRIISTLIPPDSGKVSVKGHDVSDRQRIRQMISYLPQETLLDEVLIVGEIVTLHSKLFGASIEEAFEFVERIGINDSKTLAGELSGGMKRRLCVALSLIPDREIYLLDEPFEGIDYAGKIIIQEMVRDKVKDGKSVILVSHTITGLENVADHVLILDDGEILFSGPPEELSNEFPEIVVVDVDDPADPIIERALNSELTVMPSERLCVVGDRNKIQKVVGGCKNRPIKKPSVGEVYAFLVSKQKKYRTSVNISSNYKYRLQ